MSKTLVLVTGNANKVREFNALFQKELGDGYQVVSIKELGYDADIEENGKKVFVYVQVVASFNGKSVVRPLPDGDGPYLGQTVYR